LPLPAIYSSSRRYTAGKIISLKNLSDAWLFGLEGEGPFLDRGEAVIRSSLSYGIRFVSLSIRKIFPLRPDARAESARD